jgi:hypothetical protein
VLVPLYRAEDAFAEVCRTIIDVVGGASEQLNRFFDSFDHDLDGCWDIFEMAQVLFELGLAARYMGSRTLRELFNTFDASNAGYITKASFVQHILAHPNSTTGGAESGPQLFDLLGALVSGRITACVAAARYCQEQQLLELAPALSCVLNATPFWCSELTRDLASALITRCKSPDVAQFVHCLHSSGYIEDVEDSPEWNTFETEVRLSSSCSLPFLSSSSSFLPSLHIWPFLPLPHSLSPSLVTVQTG